MPFLFDYLLKVSLSLVVVFVFYKVFLSAHTFYTWNRYFLILFSAAAFAIPLIDITPVVEKSQVQNYTAVEMIPPISIKQAPEPVREDIVKQESANRPSIGQLVFGVMMGGWIVRFIQISLYFFSFRKIRKRATLLRNGSVSIYRLEGDVQPFSFWRSIFLNSGRYSRQEEQKIIAHEATHAEQLHSIDILLYEAICLICWFNPFAWLLRRAVRENLEYIADRNVVENGFDSKDYQYLLLNVSGVYPNKMVNQLTFASLKNRIIMMNKGRSRRFHLLKYILIGPAFILLLLAFRNRVALNDDVKVGKRAIITGILLDGENGQPLSGKKIKILMDTTSTVYKNIVMQMKKAEPYEIDEITTDEDGFYFWEVPEVNIPDRPTFAIHYMSTDPNFSEFGGVLGVETGGLSGVVRSEVYFLIKKTSRFRFWDYYGLEMRDFDRETAGKEDFRKNLMAELPSFQEEHTLKLDFRKKYPSPGRLITKFQNAYFNGNQEMLGYVGAMQFFLDGKESTYDQINNYFRSRQPHLINSNRVDIKERFATRMFYYSSDTNRDSPPASIVKPKNIEWIDVKSFDLAALRSGPYFLNGFWQINGVGSNMVPERSEIKRVAILSGKLARYYNKNFDKLWWVETRPAEEIVGRPNFAKN